MTPTISTIIISYNTRATTLQCLRCLYEDLGDLQAEVWVVDNASTDGSAAAVRFGFPGVHVVENTRNLGFGAANNVAIQRATGRYLLLLNSDAFLRPGAVSHLMDYLDNHPNVGIVGPRVFNEDGSLQRSCFRFPSPARAWLEMLGIVTLFPNLPGLGDYRRWDHSTDRQVDSVIGACMLVRREALLSVGGLDERFFMYYEETDWHFRMRDRGWRVAFTPRAEAIHLGGGGAEGGLADINPTFFESRDYYYLKHYGWTGLIVMRAAMVVGYGMRAVVWRLAMLVLPSTRPTSSGKEQFCRWLFLRQAINWAVLKTGTKRWRTGEQPDGELAGQGCARGRSVTGRRGVVKSRPVKERE